MLPIEKNERYCLECGTRIYGRSDKKFCNDQCRSNYNNRQNSSEMENVRRINTLLKRNRKILFNLASSGQGRIYRSLLLLEGFDFRFFTNATNSAQGNICKYCYEYGYQELDDESVLIIKNQENLL